MHSQFNFKRLDARTRAFMVEEITAASTSDQLYYSTRFTASGHDRWFEWLLAAASDHDEVWLARQMEAGGAMRDVETRAKPKGGHTRARVPVTAAESMAEGQFNRFYIAAMCRRSMEEGRGTVVVYRAIFRDDPRPESVALEGTSKDANVLLEEVRGRESSLRCDLLRPNSGLTVDIDA